MKGETKTDIKELERLAIRNKLILDTVQNSFMLTDAELNIIDTNDALCKMTGYSRNELLKMNVSELDAKLTPEEIKINLQRAMLAHVTQLETKNRRKDGTVIDVEVDLAKIEMDGKVYFASFGRDITVRKEWELKLQESEKQLSSAASITKLAYWEYEVASRQFTFNDNFYDILKTNAEKVGGYKISASYYEEMFVYPDDKELVRRETVRAVKSADADYDYKFEYRVVYPDKKVGHVAVHFFILKDDHGFTTKVFGTIQDITDRKLIEEELRASNERFQMAAIATNDVIWDWDLVTGSVWWNENFYRLFMLEKENVRPGIDSWYDYLHPDELERAKATLAKTINEGASYWSEEYRFLKSNGEIVHIYERGYVLYNKEGKPYRIIGSMLDITGRIRAAEELRKAEQEIVNYKIEEQKMIARAIFNGQENERNRIGQELHDNVCQVLTGVKLYLARIGKKDENINKVIDYPMQLISDSIDEIRALSTKNVTPLKDMNLEELIQVLLDQLTRTTTIKTSFTCNSTDHILDEEIKLNTYRIIQEQINNIARHSEASAVSISLAIDNNVVDLLISDDGKGFDMSKTKYGMGLSNMRNRVETFNGEISIQSTPGNGCQVRIKIPTG